MDRIIPAPTGATVRRSSHASTKRLIARIIPVAELGRDVFEDAFALFNDAYAGADRDRFQRDLREKQTIILLRDRDSGVLRGFSTVLIQRRRWPRRCTVIFSGDTVIHPDYWGQKQLQSAFARILLSHKLRAPHRPLYWFLLSKGYRTYMLLANAFPRAVPRYDRPGEARLRSTLDALASERFGVLYDAATGIVRFAGGERVRDGLAPVTQRHLANPHVCFFVARNPGHAEGDELACLADVRLPDIARIAIRIVSALFRLRPVRDRAPGRRGVDVPQTEGA